MNKDQFTDKLKKILKKYDDFLSVKNEKLPSENNIYNRYKNPILTGKHAPIHWRFDLNYETNPNLLERIGVNAAFNSGAMELDGKIYLAVRVEGNDRKSFFAIAESETGIDNFRFWDFPITMPETEIPDANVYDMRLTKHEDGWIYGVFCTERKDLNAAPGDLSSATAQAGIARTKDLKTWERLPDLKSNSEQQRNVVLHDEFVDGKYAFYTRPQDGFIDAGKGGGIGWALCDGQNGTRNLQAIFILGWNPPGGKHGKMPCDDFNKINGVALATFEGPDIYENVIAWALRMHENDMFDRRNIWTTQKY